jgi:hypothetical protein
MHENKIKRWLSIVLVLEGLPANNVHAETAAERAEQLCPSTNVADTSSQRRGTATIINANLRNASENNDELNVNGNCMRSYSNSWAKYNLKRKI